MKNSKLLLALSGLVTLMLHVDATLGATAGYVQFVNGQVSLTTARGATHTLQKGEAINEGDTVSTKQSSSAQIRMQDGGFIAVRPDTQLKFDSFKFTGQAGKPESSFFSLFRGGFRAVTGLIGRINRQDYRITTPAATIGVRGTDHETVYLPTPTPGAQAGAYSKVNIGETSLTTNKGTINVLPNQMGFAGGLNQPPQLQPINTSIFTVATAPTKTIKESKKEERKENGKPEGASQKQQSASEAQDEKSSGAAEPIRDTAVVDNTKLAKNITTTVTTTAATESKTDAAITTTVAPKTELAVIAKSGGLTLNATEQTVTSGGTTVSVQDGIYSVQAKTAADAAQVAANAANAAKVAATNANTTLQAIAPVDTTTATTAIGSASTAIGSSSTGATLAVNNAIALTPADATLAAAKASAAQTAATDAANLAAAAQTALTANGTFADSTATPANTLVQSAKTAAQSANTTVQTNATAVTTQNTALSTAKTAAGASLTSANNNLTTANNTVGTVASQNTSITAAQTAAASSLSAAQAAATAAQTAATAAQTAATQAATLQAAGNLTGAQAQLVIAQEQLAIAQAKRAEAIAEQTAITTQLTNAQAAQSTGSAAVTAAANAANAAATAATTAQTQANNASTAATAASNALTTTSDQWAVVTTNAGTVATNAPIAAYNNPAVASNNFTGHMSMPAPGTPSGYNLANENFSVPQPNTQFVLDGNGSLVEMRNTSFEIRPVQSTAITSIANADVKWSGGTDADTFMLADNSIYGGRWVGATVTVTDLATTPVAPFSLTPANSLWAVLLTPTSGYVQSLVGTTSYNLAGATAPFDTAGNVGNLISASLVADFTSQLVNAAINLTMPAASSMAGTYDITANGMQINSVVSGAGYGGFGGDIIPTVSCTGTCAANVAGGYSADVGGSFAGAGAASAGLGYDLWPTVTIGSPVTDLVQGLVAFDTATPPTGPTNPAAGTWSSFGHMLLGSTGPGWERGRFNDGGQFALPETNFILDGTGNLVRSLHVDYNERFVSGTSSSANHYPDAMVTYSGGIASDHYTVGDVAIGRWTGGQMTVVDNNISLPTIVNDLGVTSSYWFMVRAEPWEYVQTLIGTTSYTQAGATLPTDSFGNVGTLPVATLFANFTSQTVDASVAFTIANQGLTIANPAIPIVVGTSSFEGTIEFNNAPMVSCTGTGCSGVYLGWLTGGFAGATASSATLAYKVWPTAVADSLVSDIIQGVAAFYTDTPPTVSPFTAYVPNHVAVQVAGSGAWFDGLASPADLFYVVDGTSANGALQSITMRDIGGGGNWVGTSSLSGGGATSANAPGFAATGIQYGAWSGYTGESNSWSASLGGMKSAPSAWMYGPSGYLDAAYQGTTSLNGAMASTFTYQLDGATAPTSRNSGLTGVVTGATVTANFVNMLVSATLDLTMPGNENWGASITNQPISLAMGALQANPVVTYGLRIAPTTCPTCSGNLSASFTGQNLTGIIAGYELWNDAQAGGGNVSGIVALTRNFTGNTNLAVADDGATVPTGYIEVATTGEGNGGFIQSASSYTTTGNLLTAFGSSGAGFSNQTTITCTTCTTTPTGQVATSGIYYGTWEAGTYAQSYSSTFTAGTMPPSYWITGPEAGPLFLPQALTGTATYAFDAGQVSNFNGVPGTVTGTTVLTLDFNKQAVGINLDFSVFDTAATPVEHTWQVYTAAGDEAPLGQGNGMSSAGFRAGNYGGGDSGLLTVSVDGGATTVDYLNASVNGQLTGAGLDGAIMSFDLNGLLNTASPTYENISGVAAFTGSTQAVNTSHRYVATSFYDPFAAIPRPMFGFYANNASRVTQDVPGLTGNLTQFDFMDVGNNGGGSSMTLSQNTSTLANQGSDAVSGISWGRWDGGTFNATDRVTGTVIPVAQTGSMHWIAESATTVPTTLPVVGTYTYTNAGGTLPTDNLGNVGTLNSATLTADFTASTVNLGVNATVNVATLDAVGTNVPIIQKTVFFASSQEVASSTSHLAVTCAGTCGAGLGGAVIGKFTGDGAIGAAMTYGLQHGTNIVSGVVAFQRGAAQ